MNCRRRTLRSGAGALKFHVRVAIDLRKLHDYGIGTYVTNLVRQLARLDRRTEYVLLTRPDDVAQIAKLGANFRAVPLRAPNYSVREQLAVPLTLSRAGATLFHAPHYVLPPLTPCRAIVTIHDCIHLRFPQYLPNRLAHAYAWSQCWAAARRARRVLTVSQASKNDILRFFNIPESKVTVIPNAIDERFHVPCTEEAMVRVRERYQLPERFIMYAGNVKPHKNLERLLDAYVTVHRRGFDDVGLLLTGSEVSHYSMLRRTVHRHNLHRHVRFLGYQTIETLAVLYRLAQVFVFPSLYEGFGLSPLEALACGTPVVASNVSSLPEVLDDAAVLVDPHDPEAIAAGITRVLEDADLRADLRKRGLERVGHFSWEQSVHRIHRIYGEIEADT